jgi:hypothetical protein
MEKFKKQAQEIKNLIQRVSFLEKLLLNKIEISLDFIIEEFFKETFISSSKKNLIDFNQKLNRDGIYLRFLQFYFLYYSNTKINLNPKFIRVEFEKYLVKTLSYDLTKNVVLKWHPCFDVSYKDLEFKNLLLFTNNSIDLNTIMDDFIKKNIEISSVFNEIIFDKNLQVNGVYPRFLSFYFLYYSFVSLNLNTRTVLKSFDDSLVTNFLYNSEKKSMTKKLGRDIVYKDLQFKKI